MNNMAIRRLGSLSWSSTVEERRESMLESWEKVEPNERYYFKAFKPRPSHKDVRLYVVSRASTLFRLGPGTSLATEFKTLVEEWRVATMCSSIMTEILLHPAYQRIIGMGARVVPLILKELEQSEEPWYSALQALTGHRPAGIADGDFATLRSAWLEWGYSSGLLRTQAPTASHNGVPREASTGNAHTQDH